MEFIGDVIFKVIWCDLSEVKWWKKFSLVWRFDCEEDIFWVFEVLFLYKISNESCFCGKLVFNVIFIVIIELEVRVFGVLLIEKLLIW